MPSCDLTEHPAGFFSISPLPDPLALREFYEKHYFQKSLSGTYYDSYSDLELSHRRLRAQILLHALKENGFSAVTHSQLLEIGSGEGFFLDAAAKSGYTVTGIDFSDAGLRNHHPHLLGHLKTGDAINILNDLSTHGPQFDICVLVNVLEHIRNPEELLAVLQNVVHPSGAVVVTVPNDFSVTQLRLQEYGHVSDPYWVCPPQHLHYFNIESIQKFCTMQGFLLYDIFTDFPIDFYLFHKGSNYVKDPRQGPPAHTARMQIDLLLAERGPGSYLNLSRSLAQCGAGRNITVILSPDHGHSVTERGRNGTNGTPPGLAPDTYRCLSKQTFSMLDYELVPIREKDIIPIMHWRNAQMNILRQSRPITTEEQLSYYEHHIRPCFTTPRPQMVLFSYLLNRRCIGYGGFVHIDWGNRRAEVSFLLDPARTTDEDTYARDFSLFLQLIKKIAFHELKFQKLVTETYDCRPLHIYILEHAGFTLEGRLKKHVMIDGKPVDSLMHACFADGG